MNLSKWGTGILLLALVGSIPVRGEDAPKEAAKPAAEKPAAAEKKEKPAKMIRLVKPWSDLTDLTEEQKTQIAELHRKALDEKKAIDAKEKADVLALLTDTQKAEVEKLTEKKVVVEKKKEEPKKEEPKAEEPKQN